MSRTLEQWFLVYPPIIRTQIFANIEALGNTYRLAEREDTLYEAINRAFTWELTNEGDNYWRKIYNESIRGTYNPQGKIEMFTV